MSQGGTYTEGVGIKGLKIQLLRMPVSQIDPTQVFELGRTIYGTDVSTPTKVVSHKNGDGVTQYQNLQELFVNPVGLITSGRNGITPNGTYLELGGALLYNTQITFSSLTPLSFVDVASSSAVSINTSGFSAGYANGSNFTSIISGTDQALMTLSSLGSITGLSMDYILGAKFADDLFHKGIVYKADYSALGTLDDRWIPDWGAVKQAITTSTAAVYFSAGTLVPQGPTFSDPGGTIDNPWAPNATNGLSVSTGSGIIMGGPLTMNTSIDMSGKYLKLINNNIGSITDLTSKGLVLQNTTAATGGVYQHSPALVLAGSSWDGGGSVPFDTRFAIQTRGTNNLSSATYLGFYSSYSGGAWYEAGSLNVAGDFKAASSVSAPYFYGGYAYLSNTYIASLSTSDPTGYRLDQNSPPSTTLAQASSQTKGVLLAPQVTTSARNLIADSNFPQYIKVTNGGSGYTTAPTITFTGGTLGVSGYNASATAVISGGQVVGVYLINQGFQYLTPPTGVSFSGGGGSGATAVILNTPIGLTIFNTDIKQYEVFNGTSWVSLGSNGYTVATLPVGVLGMTAYVTDATAPTYNAALTGGGAITIPVFYNGSIWVSH